MIAAPKRAVVHAEAACFDALAGGRTLAEARNAAGHLNVTITSGYLHVAVEEHGVGALFG